MKTIPAAITVSLTGCNLSSVKTMKGGEKGSVPVINIAIINSHDRVMSTIPPDMNMKLKNMQSPAAGKLDSHCEHTDVCSATYNTTGRCQARVELPEPLPSVVSRGHLQLALAPSVWMHWSVCSAVEPLQLLPFHYSHDALQYEEYNCVVLFFSKIHSVPIATHTHPLYNVWLDAAPCFLTHRVS